MNRTALSALAIALKATGIFSERGIARAGLDSPAFSAPSFLASV